MNCLEEGDTFGDLLIAGATPEHTRGRQVVVGWSKRGPTTYLTIRRFARLPPGKIVPTKSGVIFPAEQLHFVPQGVQKIEAAVSPGRRLVSPSVQV